MSWIEPGDDAVRLKVWLQPRSAAHDIVGVHDNHLKIKVTSPPIDDRANKDLQKFLAKRLGISLSRISILSGASGRRKVLEISGLPAERVRAMLAGGDGT